MSYRNGAHRSMHDATLAPGTGGQLIGAELRLRSLQDGTEFSLDAAEILVGRELECQLTLESGHISRYHAKLTLVHGDLVVEDLRSTNGTFINGRRISAPQSLSVGDELRFHEMAFRLVAGNMGSGAADATVFQQASQIPTGTPMPADPLQQPVRGERTPAPEPVPVVEEGTRLLHAEDLNRLQGNDQPGSVSIDSGSGPRLVMLSAPARGKVYSLISRNKNAWLIGRGGDADFQVADKTVSPQHARIRKLAHEWILESCEGNNPIFINNRSVEFTSLHPGDVIRVGRMELIFRIDEKTLVPEIHRRKALPVSRVNLALAVGALVVLGVVLGIVLV
ncbi:MAG: FHA domain-containing protein [Pseudomonadota bacterium]|nr:FHA domain-containing protein [Pseudomonadota bacterium]